MEINSVIQDKIRLILLVISSLGIEIKSEIIIPNNDQELEQIILEIVTLSNQHKELIRRACNLVEEIKQRNQPLNSYGIVKDYWDKFNLICEQKLPNMVNISLEEREHLAIKMLFELLFYAGASGKIRLEEQLNALK
jgi:hypothetical protein